MTLFIIMSVPNSYIGRRVRKLFGGFGVFVGTVVSYRPHFRGLYLIRYEDDDEEELAKEELEKHLIGESEELEVVESKARYDLHSKICVQPWTVSKGSNSKSQLFFTSQPKSEGAFPIPQLHFPRPSFLFGKDLATCKGCRAVADPDLERLRGVGERGGVQAETSSALLQEGEAVGRQRPRPTPTGNRSSVPHRRREPLRPHARRRSSRCGAA